MLHVKKDDVVYVLAGKDRGKTGRVLQVIPSQNRAVVENINMVKRHTRPNPQKNVKGGVAERESSIHLSNLALIDPESGKPGRVGFDQLSDGRKIRVSRRSGAIVDK